MRTLELPRGATPRAWGRLHGESFRAEIGSLADLRVYLACRISGHDEAGLLALAEQHLPVLEAFDADLHAELCGIAEGAATSAARIVVLNHYTDLRDLRPGPQKGDVDFDGGCTMLYARTPSGPVLAQTWDMHATAIPYVMMLRVPAASGGDAWLVSLTGCLGMAGMSRGGACVGINNLTSTDARVGVVWSALVRSLLQQDSAAAARDRVLGAPLGSGHHYLVADGDEAFGIETSGVRRELVYAGEQDSFVHANHCHHPEVCAVSRVNAASSTHLREEALRGAVDARAIESARDAYDRLGSTEGYPRSVCTNVSTPENPHAAATCAALSIDLRRREMLAVAGLPHNVEPERYGFEPGQGDAP